MLSSEQLKVVCSVGHPVEVIQDLLDYVHSLDPDLKDWDAFIECYPQLALGGEEWEDFANQKCAYQLMDELLEWLEDNAPVGWNFGQMEDHWVLLKEEI